MQCPRCQHENPPQTKFCLECGTPFAATSASGSPVRSYSDQQRALTDALGQLRTRDRELVEALDQQTATAEILRVISTSPKEDLQPVLDAVAKSAARFCGADDGEIFHLLGEGLKVSAHHGPIPSPTGRVIPVVRGSVAGRAVLERRPVQVADLQEEPRDFALGSALARESGYRTTLVAPLLREGTVVGTINLRRVAKNPFTDKQIALLQTFADQAVIAIENVRLFKELQARNQELTVALAQQTATSDVLTVISRAQTAVQPVFEAIVQSARRLCDASYSSVYRLDGQLVHLVAHNHQTPEAAETFGAAWPMSLTGDSFVVRAIRENAVIHTDMQEDPTTSAALLTRAKAVGHRRILVVPMVREGQPLGAIRVSRVEAAPFAEQHITLLKTFADQAVIAIENARLFRELEVANRELAAASQHKSEFLANMSHELRTPLNAIIGFSEVLSDRMFGELNEKQEEYLKDIYASGTHLLSLINDILDLSKVEAGRTELELSDFHLPTALDSALTLVRERAGRRGIALQINVDERLGQIQADERKVRQVVLNLLSNAIKFTPEGGRIDVGAVHKDGLVEVSVTDTGVGIAPEDQQPVFEEFRQVGTADKKVEGTGLGLTLCRKFVELHGGRIWVKSQVGEGSTFTFTIPVRRGE
jgi:signal transduction histidine kinase/putative methionine-R-sulfoxide reductase with GAF domain